MMVSLSGYCTCNQIHSGIHQSRTKTCVPHLSLFNESVQKKIPKNSTMCIEADKMGDMIQSKYVSSTLSKISCLEINKWTCDVSDHLLTVLLNYPNITTLVLECVSGDVYSLITKLPSSLTAVQVSFSPVSYFNESRLCRAFKNSRIKNLEVTSDICQSISDMVKFYQSDRYKKLVWLYKSKLIQDVDLLFEIHKFIS